ncbi:MAG: hypothetical protein D6744_11615 [Planctomycetota bacterium]|nr:MAG: hypothetical protein D6744_11615 [Planctomycetota bacterium]
MPRILLAALLAVAVAGAQTVVERPTALRRFEQNRKALISGRVEWTVETLEPKPFVKHYVSRYARNGDRIVEHRRNADGVVSVDPTGKPVSGFPKLVLERRGEIWQTTELIPQARVWRGEGTIPEQVRMQFEDAPDVRAVAIQPVSESMRQGLASIWGAPDFAGFDWEQRRDGPVYIVIGRQGAHCMTWWIDSERGWNATRALYEREGEIVAEMRCELQRFGEYWFPLTVEYLIQGNPIEIIRIASADFNSPDDPAQFAPADIGVEPGYQIGEFGRPYAEYWDGNKQLSAEEYAALERSGRIKPGKTVRWYREHHSSGQKHPYQTPDEYRAWLAQRRDFQTSLLRRYVSAWEQYVLDFIQRFELNDEQTQSAYRVLTECQQQAEPLLRRTRYPYQKLLIELQEAQRCGDQPAVSRLQERIEHLKTPFVRIFESRLKPGLQRLPTRQQRMRAADVVTSRPAVSGS